LASGQNRSCGDAVVGAVGTIVTETTPGGRGTRRGAQKAAGHL